MLEATTHTCFMSTHTHTHTHAFWDTHVHVCSHIFMQSLYKYSMAIQDTRGQLKVPRHKVS